MGTMQTVVLIAHTFIAVMIIVLVLLQRGKGADAGAAFGAGASGTVFGARGSGSFFTRATAVLATAFFASSLALAFLSSQRGDAPESLLEEGAATESPAPQEQGQPRDDGSQAPAGEMPQLEDGSAPPAEEMPALEEEPPPESEGDASGDPSGDN